MTTMVIQLNLDILFFLAFMNYMVIEQNVFLGSTQDGYWYKNIKM